MTRHIIMRTTVGTLLLALAVAGCSSSSDGDGGDNNKVDPNAPASAEEIMNGVVDAYCEMAMRCGAGMGNKETCVAFMSGMDEQGRDSFSAMKESFATGKATATKGTLKTCLDALRALECESGLEDGFSSLPACDAAFTGTVADGQFCMTDFACSGANSRCFETINGEECTLACQPLGTYCRRDADCTGGKVCESGLCETPENPPGGEGADCGDGRRCEAGLTCIPKQVDGSTTYTCAQRSGAGGSCGSDSHCQAGLICDSETSWPGVCAARPARIAEGQPCKLEDNASCADGLVCIHSADLQTAACEKPKAKGESCSKLLECGGYYSLYICDMTAKKCVDRPKSGPCPIAQYADGCDLLDAYCDTTDEQNPVCRTHKALGAACTDSDECGGPGSRAYCDNWRDNSTHTCVEDEVSLCRR
jgi:hypothetical protein